jgi:hypothetical protein
VRSTYQFCLLLFLSSDKENGRYHWTKNDNHLIFSYLSRRFTAPAERNVRWPGQMFPGPSCKAKSLQSWERR